MKERLFIYGISFMLLTEMFGVFEIVALFMAIEIVFMELCNLVESKTHLVKKWLEQE